jgi:GT2 family glycosyltransferase
VQYCILLSVMRGGLYVVHYGEDTEVTKQLMASLQPYLNSDRQLVLINNDRHGLFDSWLLPFVTVMEPDSNIGYFPAIRWAMERYPVKDLDYVMVCNNDIVFQSANFFKVLEEKLLVWDVVAPSTKTLDGVEQNPHRTTKPSFWRKRYNHLFFSNYVVAWCCNQAYELNKKRQAKTAQNKVEKTIFSPHGACIILSTRFFKQGGSLNHPIFLYGEEDSIAAQADRIGLRVGFVPELKVVHQESRSVGKNFSRTKFEHKKTAYRYIRKTYPQLF